MGDKPIIYILENHHELLYLWRKLGFKHIKVLHLDAHCDMHGTLVDRKNNFIYTLPSLKIIDCGNFISFAIQEGIISGVKWLHDKYSGRDKDATHVKYESDLTAIPYLIKNYLVPAKKYPLKYTELLVHGDNHFELEQDEHLDIDWDFFALINKTDTERQKSISLFLSYNLRRIPRYTYISYSPDYVPDTKREFDDFILQLQDKFKAGIINYSYPLLKVEKPINHVIRYKEGLNWRLRKYLFFPFKKKLNKMGIY